MSETTNPAIEPIFSLEWIRRRYNREFAETIGDKQRIDKMMETDQAAKTAYGEIDRQITRLQKLKNQLKQRRHQKRYLKSRR